MLNRRAAVIGLAVATSVAFASAGCGTKPDPPAGTGSRTSSPTPAQLSPKEALLAAVKPLTTTTFKAKANFGGGATGEAAVDPVAKSGTQKISLAAGTVSLVAEQVTVGGQAYVKATFKNFPNAPTLPTGWMSIDLAKVKDKSDYDLSDPDPSELAGELFQGLGTVERSGDRGFKGTLDLTKAKKSGLVNEDTVDALKDKAAAVPFEAAVDDKGRIAQFKIMVPAVGTSAAETWDVTYSDWGTAVTVTKPASSVPAPAAFYAFFDQ